MKQKLKHILLTFMFVFYPCFLFSNDNGAIGIFKNNNSKNSVSNSSGSSLPGSSSLAPGDPNATGDPELGATETPIEDNWSTLLFFVAMSATFVIIRKSKEKKKTISRVHLY